MPTLGSPNSTTNNIPPWKRPGAIGWWDEEFESKESSSDSHVEPKQDTSGDKTLLVFNDVQIIENTTTQPNTIFFSNTGPKSGDGLAKVADKVDAAFKIFEPTTKVVTETVTESVSAVSELVWKDIFGAPGSEKPKSNPKKDAEAQKIRELKVRIQQFQMQLESGRQTAKVAERAKIEKAMASTGVSGQEVAMANTKNVNFEGSITVANIFWIALNRTKHHASRFAKKMIPGSGRGKGKQGAGLSMNLSAQEGQSMVSSAGSIASAG